MKRCNYACNSPDHVIGRRNFLGTLAAGAGSVAGLGALVHPATAAKIAAQKKRVLSIFLAGGASQLETFDPKPGTLNGGPFRVDSNLSTRHTHLRATAENSQADASFVGDPNRQHQRERPRTQSLSD